MFQLSGFYYKVGPLKFLAVPFRVFRILPFRVRQSKAYRCKDLLQGTHEEQKP